MHPVGPRSSGVYWMRRMLVAVVAVAVVAAVVWFVVQRATGPAVDPASQNTTTTGTSRMTGVLAPDPVSSLGLSDDQAVGSTAGSTTTAGPTTTTGKKAATTKKANAKATDKKGAATTGSKATGTKATGSKTTGTKATDKKATGTQAAGTKAPNKSTATKGTATKTPATTKPTTTRPTTTPPPPPSYDDQGRLLCPDASIKVVATSGAKSYPVGSQPILGMAVTNTGSKSCVRDLSGPLQVYTVYSKAGKRMWSTADCFPGEGTDVRQLAAGQTVSYNIKWSGTTSSPGCSTPRESVAAGSYTVVAALGKLSSKPHAFTVTG